MVQCFLRYHFNMPKSCRNLLNNFFCVKERSKHFFSIIVRVGSLTKTLFVCTGVKCLCCLFRCKAEKLPRTEVLFFKYSAIFQSWRENFITVLVVFFGKKKNFEIKNLNIFKNDFQKCLKQRNRFYQKSNDLCRKDLSLCFKCPNYQTFMNSTLDPSGFL